MGREIGFILIVLGLILVAYSFCANNGGEFGAVILIGPIPIVFGSSPEMATEMMILGALILIILGFIIFMGKSDPEKDKASQMDNESASQFEKRTKIEGGGVVMIGPIPIVFGSDPRMAFMLMLAALALMLFWFIVFL